MSNISALKQQAEILLEKLAGGKRFLLGDLNARFAQARDAFPGDAVIHAVGHVVEKLHLKEPSGIISQAELENIYQELVGLNASGTVFRQVLGDLLPSALESKPTTNVAYLSGIRDNHEVSPVNLNENHDPEFDNLFKRSVADKFNPTLALDAQNKVASELTSMGFSPKVKLMGGNSQFLIFAADLDTRAGIARVQIPVEASGDKFPSAFISNGEVKQLNRATIQEHLDSFATRRAYSSTKHHTDIIEMPPVEVPEPLRVLTSQIEENVLEASVGFPSSTVRLAKKMLLSELSSMGFKGSQLRISEATGDGFICEATLNTPKGKAKIELPVEIENNVPLIPPIFAKDDFVADFNATNLHDFVSRQSTEVGITVRNDSPLYSMSLFELKDRIVRSATEGNFGQCDEAMEVLSERFDADTYRSAVSDYQKLLIDITTSKNLITQAYEDRDQFFKTPNSMYPIHKKLGKPISELIRDENGQYHLKSTYYARKNHEQEGSFFSTAKVLVGE
jgi:hypothetical protein